MVRTLASFFASRSTARFRPKCQDVVVLVERTEHRAHFHVGTEAADPGLDLFLGLRMQTDFARQRQQAERLVQGQVLAVHPAGQGGALGPDLLVLGGLTLLDIQTVGTAPDGDFLAGVGVVPQRAHALLQGLAALLAGIDRQAAGVLAGRVVGAADEAAVAAQLQPQAAVAAGGADAWIGAVFAGRKEMRAEVLVERVDDVADLQVAGLLDRLGEFVPESRASPCAIPAAPAEISSSFSSSPAVKPVST